MIIHTFCESYDFTGKTVVPFCTYAATYRDETLAEIINSTPDAAHLTGEGLTGGSADVWGKDFDEFLTSIMSKNTAVESVAPEVYDGKETVYNLNGQPVDADSVKTGIYIVHRLGASKKRLIRN